MKIKINVTDRDLSVGTSGNCPSTTCPVFLASRRKTLVSGIGTRRIYFDNGLQSYDLPTEIQKFIHDFDQYNINQNAILHLEPQSFIIDVPEEFVKERYRVVK